MPITDEYEANALVRARFLETEVERLRAENALLRALLAELVEEYPWGHSGELLTRVDEALSRPASPSAAPAPAPG